MALESIDVDPGTSGAKVPVTVDILPDGSRIQAIKLLLGADGVNGGLVDAANPVPIAIPVATGGGAANVASSASNTTLIASNSARKGFTIHNDSTAILYVKFGAMASATSFHVKMAAGDYYESPAGVNYTGIVDGIWASANGNARIGEFT